MGARSKDKRKRARHGAAAASSVSSVSSVSVSAASNDSRQRYLAAAGEDARRAHLQSRTSTGTAVGGNVQVGVGGSREPRPDDAVVGADVALDDDIDDLDGDGDDDAITAADLEVCLRVVRAAAADLSLFRSPFLHPLRAALHPLVQAQARGYDVFSAADTAAAAAVAPVGMNGDNGSSRKRGRGVLKRGSSVAGAAVGVSAAAPLLAHHSASSSGSGVSAVVRQQEEERLREMDARHRNQTALRARRLEALEALCDTSDAVHSQQMFLTGPSGKAAIENGDSSTGVQRQQQRVAVSDDEHADTLDTNLPQAMVAVSSLLPKPEIIRIPDGVAEMDASELAQALKEPRKFLNFAASCYICKAPFRELHPFYDQLCPVCAGVNFAKRDQRANMVGMVCLVTGARVKIGFRAALQLLRCGATVIATTRFPHDATRRFAAQDDFEKLAARLHVLGADFRDIAGVERLCDLIKRKFSRLDVIINNACQTIRRPAGYYKHLIAAENAPLRLGPAVDAVLSLDGELAATSMLGETAMLEDAHVPPSSRRRDAGSVEELDGDTLSEPLPKNHTDVSDGRSEDAAAPHVMELAVASTFSATADNRRPIRSADLSQVALLPEDAEVDPVFLPPGVMDVNSQQVDMRAQNSWTMRLHEVSTPELAEVFAINTIAPTVINARLKELMKESGGPDAWRFIVNVSAMEGKFYRYKSDKHPHTNMAKAALNMMTRTSASDYRKDNIFMTAVDTGWINDEKPLHMAKAHEQTHNFQTPLDEIDAASRVLDPVIQPLVDRAAGMAGEPPFGVFLKDYARCEW